LVLNENHRNEITHFHDKTIADFVEIKEINESCKVLEKDNAEFAQAALALIENNGIDLKSFSRGTFPNHLISIRDGKYNPKNKTFHEFDDIAINKTAKPCINRKYNSRVDSDSETIYKNFEKEISTKPFLKNITPLSLLNTVSNELAKIRKSKMYFPFQNLMRLFIAKFKISLRLLYERLGERYRHFIDEFQDTSEMQWQNLIPLIDNALAGQG
jgi:ATP-dependent exoDNAse (exonuclease V) beta subunit